MNVSSGNYEKKKRNRNGGLEGDIADYSPVPVTAQSDSQSIADQVEEVDVSQAIVADITLGPAPLLTSGSLRSPLQAQPFQDGSAEGGEGEEGEARQEQQADLSKRIKTIDNAASLQHVAWSTLSFNTLVSLASLLSISESFTSHLSPDSAVTQGGHVDESASKAVLKTSSNPLPLPLSASIVSNGSSNALAPNAATAPSAAPPAAAADWPKNAAVQQGSTSSQFPPPQPRQPLQQRVSTLHLLTFTLPSDAHSSLLRRRLGGDMRSTCAKESFESIIKGICSILRLGLFTLKVGLSIVACLVGFFSCCVCVGKDIALRLAN
jgi:hypothetical protein